MPIATWEEQIAQIAAELAPDVVRIRSRLAPDWSEHPAIYFRVILSDAASRPERLAQVAGLVSSKLIEELGLSKSDLIPYFRFRSQSEQSALKDEAWD